jgi:hypothetical protein
MLAAPCCVVLATPLLHVHMCPNRYSGTSADLLKTCFDLIISARIFLGRFDMRTMQVGDLSS